MKLLLNNEVTAELTDDHPASSHCIPVVVIYGQPHGPYDLLAAGYNNLRPEGDVTAKADREIARYISQMPMMHWCRRDGHLWIARSPEKPRICPKCKSPYWDRPKKKGRE